MLPRSFLLIFNGIIAFFFCVAEQQIIIICTVFSLERKCLNFSFLGCYKGGQNNDY